MIDMSNITYIEYTEYSESRGWIERQIIGELFSNVIDLEEYAPVIIRKYVKNTVDNTLVIFAIYDNKNLKLIEVINGQRRLNDYILRNY